MTATLHALLEKACDLAYATTDAAKAGTVTADQCRDVEAAIYAVRTRLGEILREIDARS